ncbi:orotate phosphoribosyltransferase [Bacteroidia bacterium]|nr:orotate phosphoribosyltransferase [Bacteroidia bacterium]MDB4174068.1 orotate phosphoribosyltransferase [Bacteroidia bacterium]
MVNTEAKIAKILLETSAIKLSPDNPFKWSSGWNSPIYCDNRTVLSFAEHRKEIKQMLSAKIQAEFAGVDTIVGVATAGIAMGALIADELGLSYAYCRPEPKAHGLKRQLEGRVDADAKIVVLEDLISTGGSSLKVVDYMRAEGYTILGMAAIFTYGFDIADQNFQNANCKYVTLGNYATMIDQAVASGYVKSEYLGRLAEWRKNPAEWG